MVGSQGQLMGHVAVPLTYSGVTHDGCEIAASGNGWPVHGGQHLSPKPHWSRSTSQAAPEGSMPSSQRSSTHRHDGGGLGQAIPQP